MSYLVTSNLKDYKSVVATSVSAQDFTTDTQTLVITGTEIDYTPHVSATHVIYSTAFAANTYGPVASTSHIKLVTGSVGGSMSDYDNGTDNNFASERTSHPHSSLITLQHEIPTWSGEKTLKLQIREESVSGGVLHGSQFFDGSITESNYGFYHPNVIIYSIIK